MPTDLLHSIRTDFQAFVEKSFSELEGKALVARPYIGLICHRLVGLAPGARHVINLPPRHLKTFIASVCFSAWMLGRDPRAKIMIIAGKEDLAEEISRRVRDLIRCDWFKKSFPKARLSKSKARKTDFAMEGGGALYAASMFGNITGRGADLIIVDDPLSISDASKVDQIDLVNSIFDDVVTNRLNNQRTGRILIVMHRLNDHDLSGHVLSRGGWRRTVLPLMARRKMRYDLGHERWERQKGELLRPDAYTPKIIRGLERDTRNPDFALLFRAKPLGDKLPPAEARSLFDVRQTTRCRRRAKCGS